MRRQAKATKRTTQAAAIPPSCPGGEAGETKAPVGTINRSTRATKIPETARATGAKAAAGGRARGGGSLAGGPTPSDPADAAPHDGRLVKAPSGPVGAAIDALRALTDALACEDWLAHGTAIEAASIAVFRLRAEHGPTIGGVSLLAVDREIHTLRRPNGTADRDATEAMVTAARLLRVAHHLDALAVSPDSAEDIESAGRALLTPIDVPDLPLPERMRAFCHAVDKLRSWSWMMDRPATFRRAAPGPDSPAEVELNARLDCLAAGRAVLSIIVWHFAGSLAPDLAAAGVDSAPLEMIQDWLGMEGKPDRLYDEWTTIKARLRADADRLTVEALRSSAVPSGGEGDGDDEQPHGLSQSARAVVRAMVSFIPENPATLDEIAGAMPVQRRLSTKTIGKALAVELIPRYLAERPHKGRDGARLTLRGRKLAKSFDESD